MTAKDLHDLQISTAIKILVLAIMFMAVGALMQWSKWYWIAFGVLAAFCIWRYWMAR